MPKFIVFICLLYPVLALSKAAIGPCASPSAYEGLSTLLKEQGIHYRIETYNGNEMLCWSVQDNDLVRSIIDSKYGRPPVGPHVGLGSEKRTQKLERILKKNGIMYRRVKYIENIFIEWDFENDIKVKKILKNEFNIDRKRQ